MPNTSLISVKYHSDILKTLTAQLGPFLPRGMVQEMVKGALGWDHFETDTRFSPS